MASVDLENPRARGEIDAPMLIARIERLPTSAWAVKARLIVGFATFFDGFDALAIAFITPALVGLWHLRPGEAGLILGAGAFGGMLGAPLLGNLAEHWGRVPTIMTTVAIFSLASLACVFAWDFQSLLAFRFIQGFGLAAAMPIAATYIAEIAQSKDRGRFVLIYEMLFSVGLLGAAFAGAWVVPKFGWQSLMAIGTLPALIPLFFRRALPESPRWLVMRGRLDEARRVVTSIERSIVADGKLLPEPDPLAIRLPPRRARLAELVQKAYRGRAALAWVCSFVVGFMQNGQWLPTAYRAVFHTPLATALHYGLITSIVSLLGVVMNALLVDRLGRRTSFLINFAGATLGFGALVVFGVPNAFRLMICGTFATFFTAANINMMFLYTPELFPTRLRATGCGTSGFFQRIGNSASPALVGFILAGAGITSVYVMLSIIGVLALVMMAAVGIETNRRVLEELSP
jgi:MFS transporter, putative metabolite:H+ symporter